MWGCCLSVGASSRAPGGIRFSGGLSKFWKELHLAAVGFSTVGTKLASCHMTTNILPRCVSVWRMSVCLHDALTGRETSTW